MINDVTERKRPPAVLAWSVWDLPAGLLWPILCVEVTAILLAVLAIWYQPVLTADEAMAAAVLGAVAVLHTEVGRPIARSRWRLTGELHVDLTSVWVFAGTILLPTGYAVMLGAGVHLYLWVRSGRTRAPLYREVFSTAAIMLSCMAAKTVLYDVRSAMAPLGEMAATAGGETLGMLAFLTVNLGLVAGAIAASSARATAAQVLGKWEDNLVTVAALVLGATAAAVLPRSPWLLAALILPLLVIQRAALVQHLEQAASLDPKTGLLNGGAWHSRVNVELGRPRSGEPQAVVVMDLDHFEDLNDEYGQLAGDQVLSAVAQAVRREVREDDIVGRYGGGEIVVFLRGDPVTGKRDLELVADRLRARVERLQTAVMTPEGPSTVTHCTISVGVAVVDGDDGPQDVTTLLDAADLALSGAKEGGRNQVRMARPSTADEDSHPVVTRMDRGERRWPRRQARVDRSGADLGEAKR